VNQHRVNERLCHRTVLVEGSASEPDRRVEPRCAKMTSMARRVLTFLGLYAALSLVVGVGLLLQVFPWHPKTVLGWIVLFGCALPICAAGEWLGSLVFENRFARRLGPSDDPKGLSWARVAYGVIAVTGLAILVVIGLSSFLRD
jgi:hypothetical protein